MVADGKQLAGVGDHGGIAGISPPPKAQSAQFPVKVQA